MNLRKYGLTLEEYGIMLAAQDGKCAVCRTPAGECQNQYGSIPLAVDHDHVTGKVRGLLCMKCNRAAGFLQDDPEIVRNLATYLSTHADS